MQKCSKHPRFTGKKMPKINRDGFPACADCLTLYLTLKSYVRKPVAPPKRMHRDATKYDRKKPWRKDE